MKRPTIADVAQQAGVTKAAVSFALNGQPGVSAATRERVLAIAAEIGFQPSGAARALTGGKAEAFGLVIDRPARTLGIEPFFMQVISGIQDELSAPQQMNLLFTMATDADAEIDMYRRWWAQRRVDGVFVVDLQVHDRRIPVLEELRMPAVVVGTPRGAGALPVVWQDDRAGMETVVRHLAGLGHRRIARVGGCARYWHSVLRGQAFASVMEAAGLAALSVEADYTAEHGAQATAGLLCSAEPPTAIIYDSDVMATAGLGMAQRMGIGVPNGVSIVSWEDSLLCELTNPGLTALRRDIPAVGSAAARMLRELAAGGHPGNVEEIAPTLQVRASSGPAGVPVIPVSRPTRLTVAPRLTPLTAWTGRGDERETRSRPERYEGGSLLGRGFGLTLNRYSPSVQGGTGAAGFLTRNGDAASRTDKTPENRNVEGVDGVPSGAWHPPLPDRCLRPGLPQDLLVRR